MKADVKNVCQFCQNWLDEAFLAKTPYNGRVQRLSKVSESGVQNVRGRCPES